MKITNLTENEDTWNSSSLTEHQRMLLIGIKKLYEDFVTSINQYKAKHINFVTLNSVEDNADYFSVGIADSLELMFQQIYRMSRHQDQGEVTRDQMMEFNWTATEKLYNDMCRKYSVIQR